MKKKDSFLTPESAGVMMQKWRDIFSRVFPDVQPSIKLEIKHDNKRELTVYLWNMSKHKSEIVAACHCYINLFDDSGKPFKTTIHKVISTLEANLRDKTGYKYTVNKEALIPHDYFESIVKKVYKDWQANNPAK